MARSISSTITGVGIFCLGIWAAGLAVGTWFEALINKDPYIDFIEHWTFGGFAFMLSLAALIALFYGVYLVICGWPGREIFS